MTEHLTRFRISLERWFATNKLDQDSHFNTAEEWRGRGEDLLRGAELILTTEGGLHFLLNYNFDQPKVEEFDDLCESFGYWFEVGHSWSVGFYRLGQAAGMCRLIGSPGELSLPAPTSPYMRVRVWRFLTVLGLSPCV